MHTEPVRRSSLFLLELMTAILFFCLCTGYCVKMFAYSHQVSSETCLMTHAIRQCGNVAELFRGTEDYRTTFSAEYPDGIWKEDSVFVIYYDEDWNPCGKASACSSIRVELFPGNTQDEDSAGSGALLGCAVTAYDSSENEIYKIYAESYCKGGAR